jgi:hypothetical protein
MKNKFTALSLGWGVQTFTLACMAALGEIEMPDIAIYADVYYEKKSTYDFINKWEGWLIEKGLKIKTVSINKKIVDGVWEGRFIPLYTYDIHGKAGKAFRSCTGRWKIEPIRKWLQLNRNKALVDLWIGISLDEYKRMKDSDVKYITNKYPLIEMKMTRSDCKNWLLRHNLDIPPRSACWYCPFQDQASWRYTQTIAPDFHNAILLDRQIRNARSPMELYLHPSRKPLEEIDFRTMEEMGQTRLWDEECAGLCGV